MLQTGMIHDPCRVNDVLPHEVPYNWGCTKIGIDQVQLSIRERCDIVT
jgi:hypothetical protein